MKKLSKHLTWLLSMFVILPIMADNTFIKPQTPEGVYLEKSVTQEPDINNQYTITLESYVTGSTTIVQDVKPCDIILLVDMSTSMVNNTVEVEVTPGTKTPVAQGTTLSTSNTYVAVDGGKEYFMKMFRVNNGSYSRPNYVYYVRIKEGSEPTSRTDGSQYGSASYTSPYTVNATDNIYLYTPGTTEEVTRLEALKRASKSFVESILANSPTEGKHKISIIGFHSSAVEISGAGFTEVTDASASNLKTAIDEIFVPSNNSYTGINKWKYTNPAVGFYKATQLFDQVYDDGRKKVVVFFTDGVPAPQGTDSFNANMASVATNVSYVLKQPTTATNVNYTYTDPNPHYPGASNVTTAQSQYYTGITNQKLTKGYGATVYSIALLDNTSPGAQTARFLNLTSSNYPNKLVTNGFNFNSGEGNEAPHDYYQLSSGSDLTSIFTRIANASSEAEYELSAESTVVLDVMSSYFRLPAGTQPEDIMCYESTFGGIDTKGDSIWAEPVNLTVGGQGDGKDLTVVIGGEDGKDVSITGFDFSENFVGDHQVSGSTDLVPGGKKLIIQIKIEVDPANEGGATLLTNDQRSGIYVKNKDTQEPQAIAYFFQPSLSLPNIIIRAQGLEETGESASYTIYKVLTTIDAESVTEDGDYHFSGTYNDDVYDPTFEPIHVILTKSSNSNPTAKIKLNQEGRYKVVEDTWAYTYDLTLVKDYSADSDNRRDPDEYSDANTTKLYDQDGNVCVPNKDGQYSGNTIVRTICLGTEAHANDDPDNPATKRGDGTLFDFVHGRHTATSATSRAEAAKVNWKQSTQSPSTPGEEVVEGEEEEEE